MFKRQVITKQVVIDLQVWKRNLERTHSPATDETKIEEWMDKLGMLGLRLAIILTLVTIVAQVAIWQGW